VMAIVLRQATADDSEMLFNWRNDPDTRVNSLNSREISRSEHESWFARILTDPGRKIFVAMKYNEPVGTLRVDFDADHRFAELSWTVSPRFRGKGFGKEILVAACNRFGGTNLKARIKSSNLPSIKMASACGFQLFDEIDGVQSWFKK
jgi:UDP-2,4-diacetamido-2,4,6-trideoxy-beta-L-altropyranose hydrolase